MKILITLIFLISLISCNSSKGAENNNFMLINPFVDCKSITEAEKIAGFKIVYPDNLFKGNTLYRVLNTDEKMIEIIFKENDGEITLRKSISKNDISGLYFDFKEETTININNINITLRGFSESYVNAIWSDNTYSYSIYIPSGRDSSYFEQIVGYIK